jgi:hypothetical protein
MVSLAFRPLIWLIMDAMLAFPEHSFVPNGFDF